MMLQVVLVLATLCNAFAFSPIGAVRNTRSMQMSSTDNKMVGASIEVNGGTFIAEYSRVFGTALP